MSLAGRVPRDQNRVPVNYGVSSVDGVTPLPFEVNPLNGRLLTDSTGGGGGSDVQYIDGSATVAHPTGTIPVFNNAGTITAVSAANPLPVSATISTAGLATSANQTNNSQKTQLVDASGNAVTVTGNKLDVNATASLAGTTLPISGATTGVGVAIVDGSGNQITSFGGGTQYADGVARGTATGTIAMVDDGTLIQSAKGDTDGTQQVNTTKIVGTAIDVNSGNKSAGTQRIVLATDQPQLTNPLKVDGSAVTQPVSLVSTTITGTVAATQSGTWNITNISGTISLPTGAATAAKQPAIGTAGSSSVDVLTVQGRASMTPLLIDGSSTTQPVSNTGTFAVQATLAAETTKVIGTVNQGTSPWVTSNATTSIVGNGAAATAQRVTLANDSTGIIGTVGAVTAITNALPTGTNSLGKISDITTSIVPGTAATNLGKAEDAAHASGDTGVFALAVRNDGAATAFSGTNGDYTPIGVDAAGTVSVAQKSGTATLTNVNSSATNVTILAANTARKGAQFFNDSTQILYLKFGTTASTTSFTVPLAAATYYELPAGYTGNIDGIWASAVGVVRVTEET